MVRRTGLALAWLGLSTATMVLSLSACFVDLTEDKKGTCEDDLNPCTEDSCVGGTQIHTSITAGTTCFLGDNEGTCNGGMESDAAAADRCILNCETKPQDCSCVTREQCPEDEECAKWSCESGFCARSADKEGLPIGEAKPDDCMKEICQGGKRVTAPDINDPPPSDECVLKSCDMAGAIVETPAPLGTNCNSETNECNGKGQCVTCFAAGELNSCGQDCKIKLCNGEPAIDGTNCQSGNAADGVCCDTACTEVCKTCSLMGMKGTCSNIPYYEPDPTYIPAGGGSPDTCNIVTAGGVCDGNGQCLKVAGKPCQEGPQCISGMCSGMLKCLGKTGEFCIAGADCISGMCMAGACT